MGEKQTYNKHAFDQICWILLELIYYIMMVSWFVNADKVGTVMHNSVLIEELNFVQNVFL